jgi:hypothetical protein
VQEQGLIFSEAFANCFSVAILHLGDTKMARPKQANTTHEWTVPEIDAKLRELEVIASVLTDFREAIMLQPSKTLAANNSKSLEQGLDRLQSCAMAMQKAIWASRTNLPIPTPLANSDLAAEPKGRYAK